MGAVAFLATSLFLAAVALPARATRVVALDVLAPVFTSDLQAIFTKPEREDQPKRRGKIVGGVQ